MQKNLKTPQDFQWARLQRPNVDVTKTAFCVYFLLCNTHTIQIFIFILGIEEINCAHPYPLLPLQFNEKFVEAIVGIPNYPSFVDVLRWSNNSWT